MFGMIRRNTCSNRVSVDRGAKQKQRGRRAAVVALERPWLVWRCQNPTAHEQACQSSDDQPARRELSFYDRKKHVSVYKRDSMTIVQLRIAWHQMLRAAVTVQRHDFVGASLCSRAIRKCWKDHLQQCRLLYYHTKAVLYLKYFTLSRAYMIHLDTSMTAWLRMIEGIMVSCRRDEMESTN